MSSPSTDESPSFLAEDRGWVVLAAIWPIQAVATFCVAARFMARKLMKVDWAIDDYAVVVALVLSIGCTICSTMCVHYGIGKHIQAVPAGNFIHFWKTLYAYNQIYVATGPATKIAVLLMYRRIFATKMFRDAVMILGTLTLMWYLGEALSGVFTCIPVQDYWEKPQNAKCIDLKSYDIGYAVVNIGLDVFILVLPIRMVWGLKTTIGQKIALTFAFLLGGFACITALIRLLTAVVNVENPDLTWIYTNVMIWTAIEPSIGVISACLPTLRPVFVFVLPKQFAFGALKGSDFNKGNSSTSGARSLNYGHGHGRKWPADKYFSRLDDQSLGTLADSDGHPLKGGIGDVGSHPIRSPEGYDIPLEEGVKTTIEGGDKSRAVSPPGERYPDGIKVTTDLRLHAV